ncbi:hypothetical protein H7X46_18805 [Pseudonocardia sp. C8]|uniref:hypothetical protein n=1 Tax=Pseudonocardia sp. C8 TaxID=2762759 RepID=UPI0016432649|nr:hypothetical protein [Pseudonocardia sp. C8]MBC3193114.1 hypothetical protein [Pseudonocardia sp. C8]
MNDVPIIGGPSIGPGLFRHHPVGLHLGFLIEVGAYRRQVRLAYPGRPRCHRKDKDSAENMQKRT